MKKQSALHVAWSQYWQNLANLIIRIPQTLYIYKQSQSNMDMD